MALNVGSRLGHYDVTALIGEGGMGQVYQATDTKLNRQVALKILPEQFASDPDRLARFQREAQVLASLNHPGIAAIYGLEESEETRALVLELVEGPTLADRIAKGPLAFGEALPIAKQIAEALETAHEQGIIHRDLKPANIKVRQDGTVKVLDFGLAKALASERQTAGDPPSDVVTRSETAQGVILGTAAYMSPEQARGEDVDRRTDIWAFGCLLFEMLTGARPFAGKGVSEILANVLKESPDMTALSGSIPPLVVRLLRRCLEKDPRKRLRDMADARADLEDSALGTEPVDGVGPRAPSRSNLPVGAIVGVAIVILGIVLGAPRLWSPTARPAEPRQFVLVPPEGVSFGGPFSRTPAFSVSPDGQRLAFLARAGSSPSIWLRTLDALDAAPISGTEGASGPPAWSPDGAFLAFFADDKLKTVGIGGGGPVTLADAPAGSGVTWNADGTIVFAPSTQSGLLRIASAGGTPSLVTELGSGDLGHVYPQFLPDGRHFLYLVRAPAPRKGIYVASLDSPEETYIRPEREKALYASPGYLLFLDDGVMMAQTFDAGRLELSGEPIPVTESVAFVSTVGRASYDVSSTGTLAYRVSGVLSASQPILVDRSGTTIATGGAPGDYQTVRLSPDGSRVAVELHDLRTGAGDLWTIDLTRNNSATRFTFDGMHNTAAVWSPDGTELVFTGRPDGVRNLHLRPVDGSKPDEPLLARGPDRTPDDWSTDGRHILYEEGGQAGRDLWTLRMPEREPVPFLQTEFDERTGRFSPDGRWVAYASNETGRYEVYVRSFPDATGTVKVSIGGGDAPQWAPGGDELFFIDADKAVHAVSVRTGETFEYGVPEVLFTPNIRSPGLRKWTTDGQRFLIVPNPPGPVQPQPPITIVEDWVSLLGRGTS